MKTPICALTGAMMLFFVTTVDAAGLKDPCWSGEYDFFGRHDQTCGFGNDSQQSSNAASPASGGDHCDDGPSDGPSEGPSDGPDDGPQSN